MLVLPGGSDGTREGTCDVIRVRRGGYEPAHLDTPSLSSSFPLPTLEINSYTNFIPNFETPITIMDPNQQQHAQHGAMGAPAAGQPAAQGQDYGDKAFGFLAKKSGHNVDASTSEKITDGARGLFEKATG